MINFEQINHTALARLPDLLPELLPEGRFHGREFRCGDLEGNAGQSLSVNTDTGKWADFATGDKGGDPVSLVAAVRGLSQVEAACWLGGIDTTRTTTRPTIKRTPDTWKSIPADSPPKSINHDKHGRPSATWEYRGPAGELLGLACRFDPVGEKKLVLPYIHGMDTTTGETGWQWKAFSALRPLYGLDRLALRPDAPALIVEGEKTADAAQRLLPAVIAITWPGGSGAVAFADFSPLKDRRVAIWPDNDEPGRKAGEAAARAALRAGAGEVSIISPPNKAEGWDLADAEDEGWTPAQVAEWIKGHKWPAKQVEAAPVGQEWPEPSPLIVHQQADPYPLEALPGTIGAAVREVVAFVQCPVALGACSALAVVSTVAQGLVDVRRADKLEGPTSLFLLAVADSGERKTTVDGFFSKPVAQWEAEQTEAAKPDLKRYEAGQATWEAKKSGLLVAVKEASKRGKPTAELERKVADLEAEKPEPPRIPRLLHEDTTPEALAFRLAKGWPVGGVLSSEAGTVFGGHAMGKDSAMRNMGLLNKLWEGGRVTVDRRSVESFIVQGARLTMGLAVQPEAVRTFLDSSKGLARGIGFLARFLIAWPESTQGGRSFKNSPETWPNLAKFHRRLGALLDCPLPVNDRGELEPATLELSPEAKAVWVAFHDDIEAELRPGRDMAETRDVASKAADNAARLAALFHLFENDHDGTIDPKHMRAAARLASWHLYEARRFMGEIALPVEVNNAAKLEAWLLERCKQKRAAEVSTREIQQEGPNCTRDKLSLDAALAELDEAGRVRVVKEGRRRLVKINPALLGGGYGTA